MIDVPVGLQNLGYRHSLLLRRVQPTFNVIVTAIYERGGVGGLAAEHVLIHGEGSDREG